MDTRIEHPVVIGTALKFLVLAVTVGSIYMLASHGLLEPALSHPVVACLLLDCFLIHAATDASPTETLSTVAIGSAGYILLFASGQASHALSWGAFCLGASVLGISSLFVLSVRALELKGQAGWRKLRTYGRGSIFLCMAIWSIPFLKLAMQIRAHKLDLFLYAFDAGFGFQPSFAMGRLFAAYPRLASTEMMVYVTLAVPVALVYIGHLRKASRFSIDILALFLLNSCLGYVLFWIFPAAGPSFAFAGSYPMAAPPVASLNIVPISLAALPNAMPSVHVSTALLVWFNSRPWRTARVLALIFLIATMVSTLGLGEHYLIDLVVAFPYAVLVQSLAMSTEGRRRAILTSAILTGGWLVFLGFGKALLPMPFAALAGAPITVALALFEEQRLSRLLYGTRSAESPAPALAPALASESLTAAGEI